MAVMVPMNWCTEGGLRFGARGCNDTNRRSSRDENLVARLLVLAVCMIAFVINIGMYQHTNTRKHYTCSNTCSHVSLSWKTQKVCMHYTVFG